MISKVRVADARVSHAVTIGAVQSSAFRLRPETTEGVPQVGCRHGLRRIGTDKVPENCAATAWSDSDSRLIGSNHAAALWERSGHDKTDYQMKENAILVVELGGLC